DNIDIAFEIRQPGRVRLVFLIETGGNLWQIGIRGASVAGVLLAGTGDGRARIPVGPLLLGNHQPRQHRYSDAAEYNWFPRQHRTLPCSQTIKDVSTPNTVPASVHPRPAALTMFAHVNLKFAFGPLQPPLVVGRSHVREAEPRHARFQID